ncbi:MAG: hypothetical protein V1918_09210 [Planctomycetota bacterium]
MGKGIKACLFAAAALFLFGCGHKVYEIDMKPDGDRMERRLVCFHAGDSGSMTMPAEELARIAEAYGRPAPSEAEQKSAFQGSFTEKMPQDVGGAGYFLCLSTPLGDSSFYGERFRGDDNIARALVSGMQAADRLIDLVSGWLQTHPGEEKDCETLRAFCDAALREDLKNAALYLWAGMIALDPWAKEGGAAEEKTGADLATRLLLYFSEHGYFTPSEIPVIARRFEASVESELPLLVQETLAQKTGLPKDSQALRSLSRVLAGEEEASFAEHIRTTDAWKERLKRWEEEKAANPEAEEPTPRDLAGELAVQAFFPFSALFSEDDQIAMRIECPAKPWATNGTWDGEKSLVSWSGPIRGEGTLPTLAYAAWSLPNEAFQQERFGRTVLEDEALAKYAIWYKGLDPEETAEWDMFLGALRPEGDPAGEIAAFLFAGERGEGLPDEESLGKSLAREARALLLNALSPLPAGTPSTGEAAQP